MTTTELVFRDAWRRLAKLGKCDEIDGCEYERVFAEWMAAGDDVHLSLYPERFIIERANIGPVGIVSVGGLTSRGRCRCTYEAGDSFCDVHPTCDDCGESLELVVAYTANGGSDRYCRTCYERLAPPQKASVRDG